MLHISLIGRSFRTLIVVIESSQNVESVTLNLSLLFINRRNWAFAFAYMLFFRIIPCSIKLFHFFIVSCTLIYNLIQFWLCKRGWGDNPSSMFLRAKRIIWKSTRGSKFLKLLLILLLRVLSIWIWNLISWKSIFLLFSLFSCICLLKWLKSLSFAWRLSTTLISLNLGRSLGMARKVPWNGTQRRLWVFYFLWKIVGLVCFAWADSCYFLLWRFLLSKFFMVLLVFFHCINSV